MSKKESRLFIQLAIDSTTDASGIDRIDDMLVDDPSAQILIRKLEKELPEAKTLVNPEVYLFTACIAKTPAVAILCAAVLFTWMIHNPGQPLTMQELALRIFSNGVPTDKLWEDMWTRSGLYNLQTINTKFWTTELQAFKGEEENAST